MPAVDALLRELCICAAPRSVRSPIIDASSLHLPTVLPGSARLARSLGLDAGTQRHEARFPTAGSPVGI